MQDDLRAAYDELERANEHASRTVRQQLNSIEEGMFEELDGERTQAEPGPKADRIAELEKKLDGLADEAEDPTHAHIAQAREHLRSYRGRRQNGE